MIIRKSQWFITTASLVNTVTQILFLHNCFNVNLESEVFWTIQTWASLCNWGRFIIYLRSFENFNWMVGLFL